MDSTQFAKVAQEIWSNLDNLSEKNPEEYKRFVTKMLQEGKDSVMKPPVPKFSIETKFIESDDSRNLVENTSAYITVFEWSYVPAPKDDYSAVPIIGTNVINFSKLCEKNGEVHVFAVAFNHDFLSGIMKNKNTNQLAELVISFYEKEKHIKFSKKCKISYSFKGNTEQQKTVLLNCAFSKPDFTLKNSKNLMEMSSLVSKIKNSNSTSEVDESKITLLPDNQDKQSQKCLIEVLNSHEYAPTVPHYEVKESTKLNTVLIKVNLPGVKKSEECILSISDNEILLEVNSLYRVKIPTSASICEEKVKAQFLKKSSVLLIKCPLR